MTSHSDVDAVVLVGGIGTRLRPLTLTTAKPMLPTAGVPFLQHVLSRIRAAGIRHAVLCTAYKAETFTRHFGDGRGLGLEIDYAVEDAPLGTGGAIRNVADRLRGTTAAVFNGDVLSGVDLPSLIGAHREKSADVTLHLVRVSDPRAFGSVPTEADGRVSAFLEKSDAPPTDQINAGCYIFRRSVLEAIPTGRVISVERETFPGLLATGGRVFGHLDQSYWLDVGTPAALVRASADLVTGVAPTDGLPGRTGSALILPGAELAGSSIVDGGSTIGRGSRIGPGARVDGSVLFDGVDVGEGATIVRSVIGHRARIGPGARICDAVIGEGADIGARSELLAGVRVSPNVTLPPTGVRFSADVAA